MPVLHPYHQLMLQAVELSRRGFGRAAPNPCVGALIVRDGEVLAQGWHDVYGGPHAERAALADAAQKGVSLEGASLLVTLEPCNHHGKTPPCTEAILASGIRHVVVGALDPNPKACGGAERLRAAGLNVETGVAEAECLDNIRDFMHFQSGSPLPYVILKLASTLDGRIAARSGHSQWVSSPESRQRVHWLRSRVQAVLVGSGTFTQDDPLLDARADMLGQRAENQPLAVVAASRLPQNYSSARLLRERPKNTIFFTAEAEAAGPKGAELRALGAEARGLPAGPGGLDLTDGLEYLRRERGCLYVMCEGGGRLGLSLLRDGLAHEFLLFQAPKILGDNMARPLFDGLAPERMDEALVLRPAGSERLGGDICLRFFTE